MPKLIDMTSQVFGRLTAIEHSGREKGHTMWLCKCECGKKTTVRRSSLTSGNTMSCGCLSGELSGARIKEQLTGKMGQECHNWSGGKSLDKDGYLNRFSPEHPNKKTNNYVLEHHLIMEKHIGRYLIKNEVVHHTNKDRTDNRIENLVLFASQSEHRKHHIEMEA